ncbi:MAG: GNAT family N-acetyltransferase [Candidatus Woesearchaeota archaeon]|nr:GNAT family N-acetyltransferase [Candidatus Woesearchaeota archaeon]
MGIEFSVREFDISDKPRVMNLAERLAHVLVNGIYENAMRERCRFMTEFEKTILVEDSSYLTYVAVHDDDIIGFVSGYISQSDFFASAIYVKEEYRGQGIFSALRNEAICYARSKGLKNYVSKIFKTNKLAICAETKAGSNIMGTEEDMLLLSYPL